MDTNKHKFFMLQLLKDIFSDTLLSSVLAFKGGTATMFFYDLPRFSTDLDFNLLNPEQEKEVYDRVRKIVLKYGKIHDEAIKHYGIVIVLDVLVCIRHSRFDHIAVRTGQFYQVFCDLFGVSRA